MSTLANEVIEQINKQEKYSVFIAEDEFTKNLCYKLRYDVFAKELNAQILAKSDSLDKDKFDDHCHHLVVFDNQLNEIVATTRLLDNTGRLHTKMFYSETEFDLSNVFNSDLKYVEVGRTCIHPAYRRGIVLAILWRGIADYVVTHNIDYLMGCASIPLSSGDKYISSLMNHIGKNHYAPKSLRVMPLIPLRVNTDVPHADDVILPTLLKAYVRQGALVCGQPYWDIAFGVADLFILLEASNITDRYSKHFIDRIES